MKQLHEIQLQILNKLLFSQSLPYSKLKPDVEMENNKFSFHLNELVDSDLVSKDESGYRLTTKGKEYANQMDTGTVTIMKQAKISAWVCPTQGEGADKQYLIYTRLKQPFYGAQGFMSGKVQYGEFASEAAEREMMEETGLKGEPTLVGIRHYVVIDKLTGKVVEDKFMYMFIAHNPTGELQQSSEGKYEWVKKSEFKEKVTNHFQSFEEFLHDIHWIDNFKGDLFFEEKMHFTDKF